MNEENKKPLAIRKEALTILFENIVNVEIDGEYVNFGEVCDLIDTFKTEVKDIFGMVD